MFLGACAVQPDKAEYDKAAKELEEIKGPDVKGINATLEEQAKEALKAGSLKQAEIFYKQLLDKDKDNTQYLQSYADILRREDRCKDALPQYDLLIDKDDKNAAALEGKGLCVMAKGDVPGATDLFGKVMKIDPKRWRTLNGIGILFATKGMSKEAIAYYEEALQYNPDYAAVYNNLGLTQALNKNYDEAIKAFEKAKSKLPESSPDVKRVALNEALAYGIWGKTDDAKRVAEPYLSKAALYNNLGFYAHLANDEALAKSYLNMALNSSVVYYEKAWDNLQEISALPQDDDRSKDRDKK